MTLPAKPVIGVLYPGEMGSTLARALRSDGFAILTTLVGRSPRTCALCAAAGVEVVSSLADVAVRADIVLSLVTPGAAVDMAREFAACPSVRAGLIYVDLNSTSPETAKSIEGIFTEARIDFVDGAIYGLASQLRERGAVYLSGPHAANVAAVLNTALPVEVVGDDIGQASAFKMLIGGFNKGIVALFFELALLADKLKLLRPALAKYQQYYPGVMEVIDRLVPTYVRHATRRAEELRELEKTIEQLGLKPIMASAARDIIGRIAQLNLVERYDSACNCTVPEVVEAIAEENPCSLPPHATE